MRIRELIPLLVSLLFEKHLLNACVLCCAVLCVIYGHVRMALSPWDYIGYSVSRKLHFTPTYCHHYYCRLHFLVLYRLVTICSFTTHFLSHCCCVYNSMVAHVQWVIFEREINKQKKKIIKMMNDEKWKAM